MGTCRRLLAGVSIAVAGTALVAAPAYAAPPTKVTETVASVTCVGATTTGEPVIVQAGTSPEFGDSAFVRVGDQESPRLLGFSIGGGWRADGPSFDLQVTDADRNPVGTGTFTATTTVTAQTETDTKNRNGNQIVKAHIVASVLDAEAQLVLPDVTVGPLECSGRSTVTTYTRNNPASTVRVMRELFDSVRCEGNAVVALFGPAEGEYFVSVEIEVDGQQYNLFGPVEPERGTFTVVLPLRNSDTGEEIGRFPVTITTTPSGETTTTVLRTSKARVVQKTTPYEVSGSVSTPFGDFAATCEHLEILTREHISASQGPKPGGRAPANDTLATATALGVGDTARDTNRGAAEEAEVGLECSGEVGRTLWYSFVGTGDTVRIDTAGSNFDTALAVYTSGADGLETVACGDDVDSPFPYPRASLQGNVELDTVAGVTYYVQVGGVFGDYGRLVLSID